MSYKGKTIFVALFMAILSLKGIGDFSDTRLVGGYIAVSAVVIAVAALIFKRVDKYKAQKKTN